jgi:hypothetical protein
MTTSDTTLSFPLDEGGFFRRACPLCRREFKVQMRREELGGLIDHQVRSFLLMAEADSAGEGDAEDAEADHWCPYCGQNSPRGEWWTEDQVAYIHTALRNIFARLLNEHLIGPLNREFGRSRGSMISVRFEGKKLPEEEMWVSPEPDDMTRFMLPCCGREIKLEDDWLGPVHCFYCGFPHRRETQA